MNSCIDLVITGMQEITSRAVFSKIENEAIFYEKLLSCHDPEAEVFMVNERAHWEKVHVSEKLWNILIESFQLHVFTKGYFDVGLKNYNNQNVRTKGTEHGIKGIELDIADHSVRFTSDYSALDFGAVGKGLLLREIRQILDDYTVENCMVSFGGSSVLTKGSHPHGTCWPLSLRDTYETDMVFHLNNHCVSISSNFNDSGKNLHIVNPGSLKLENNNRTTVVQCQCPVMAEALSTTLILAKVEEAETIISNFKPFKALIFSMHDNRRLSIEYTYEQTD
jgi:FAD:protein FMN transferase